MSRPLNPIVGDANALVGPGRSPLSLSAGDYPMIWGRNQLEVWILFVAPLLAGGAGRTIRPIADRLRGNSGPAPTVLAILTPGLVAGGVSGLLFVTAQLSADPPLAANQDHVPRATRSISVRRGSRVRGWTDFRCGVQEAARDVRGPRRCSREPFQALAAGRSAGYPFALRAPSNTCQKS